MKNVSLRIKYGSGRLNMSLYTRRSFDSIRFKFNDDLLIVDDIAWYVKHTIWEMT